MEQCTSRLHIKKERLLYSLFEHDVLSCPQQRDASDTLRMEEQRILRVGQTLSQLSIQLIHDPLAIDLSIRSVILTASIFRSVDGRTRCVSPESALYQ